MMRHLFSGDGGIRTHGPVLPDQTISSRSRYGLFDTSPDKYQYQYSEKRRILMGNQKNYSVIAPIFFAAFTAAFSARSSLKNAVSISLQSSFKMHRSTSTWWLNASISSRFKMLPAHPAFGIILPMTTRLTLAWTIAPAHIWQGSKVTYNVQSSRRQSPSFLLAFLIARISAWDKVFLSVLRRL